MTAFGTLSRIAADPDSLKEALPTARQIIEARLGRSLGPVQTMRKDERIAVLKLGQHLAKQRRGLL